MLVRDVMTKEVIAVKPDQTVEEVAKLIIHHKISGVPVVNAANEVVGIVTEADLLVRNKKLHVPAAFPLLGGVIYLEDPEIFEEELRKAIAVKVEELMSEDILTVEEDDTLEEAATIMLEEGVNRLPVVKDDKLVGIISRRDIVKSLISDL